LPRRGKLFGMPKSSFKFEKTITSYEALKAEERAFWHSRTPLERLEVTELMRQITSGYNPLTGRVQRILTVVERKKNKRASGRLKDLDDLEILP
jgi:hypothetical protein